MKTTPTALILDFGGVLTTDLWASVRACSRREGLADDALLNLLHRDPDIHHLFVGLERGEVGQAHFEAQLAAAAGLSPHGLLNRMCADLRPDHAMLSAVAILRDAGIRIGVLSNTWGTGYFNPYKGYDLQGRADAVILSDQVGYRKPEPEIFAMMLDLLAIEPHTTVFVDDVATNLPPAAALGMTVIHHVNTRLTVPELERLFSSDLHSEAVSVFGHAP